MKQTLITAAIVSIAAVAFAGEIEKSTSTTTTTHGGAATTTTSVSSTSSTGTLTEYTPGSAFVIKESSGPMKYRYGKSVTYVTKSGRTLSDDEVRTHIKVGSPVSVHYSTEGGDRVISRVEIAD